MSSVIFDEGESARYEFPKMLYRMLQEVSADPVDSKIVSWQEHGRSFKVHNREEVERVLARFFRVSSRKFSEQHLGGFALFACAARRVRDNRACRV